jgi:hypothetical protein
MEEVLDKVFMDSTANDLKFVYYKERHVHLEVFYEAIQKQRLAVEGLHPDEVFVFEKMLCKQFPEIESVHPTSKSTAQNNHGLPIGRYNILCKKLNFSTLAKKLHQEFTSLYHQHLQDNDVELQENHQAVRVTSRLPRSDNSSCTIPSMDSRTTFFTHLASIFEDSQINWEYSMEFPSVVETNISAQKQSCPTSPSITSGIAGTKFATKMPCVVHTCHQSVRRHFDNSKLIVASSTRNYGSTYKPCGTLQLSRGSITGWVAVSGTDDMGRWCWTTYNGSANR